MEIIDLCQIPGLPMTRLQIRANLCHSLLKVLLFGLLDEKLIEVETRPLAFDGSKRVTEYYVRTKDGDEILDQFKELKEKISIEVAPSG